MRRDSALLWDIDDAGNAAVSYVVGMDKHEFLNDRRTQKAVTCEILVIGEAVKKLSLELRQSHSGVPWAEIAGMRDKLVHDYHHIELDRLWVTVKKDIPDLLRRIAPLLKRHD